MNRAVLVYLLTAPLLAGCNPPFDGGAAGWCVAILLIIYIVSYVLPGWNHAPCEIDVSAVMS